MTSMGGKIIRGRRVIRLVAFAGLAFASACSGGKRTIRVPESIAPDPARASTRGKGRGEPVVVKMSDGKRTFQFEIPMAAGTAPFQATVPIDVYDAAVDRYETEADREIKEAARKPDESAAAAPGEAPAAEKPGGEKPTAEKKGAEKEPAAKAAKEPQGRSYLATLARVNGLFRKRQYELALIDLVALEREYPDDERILEMKGTLYWRLKKPKLAREAWERVLALNPDNAAVAQALEHLLGD